MKGLDKWLEKIKKDTMEKRAVCLKEKMYGAATNYTGQIVAFNRVIKRLEHGN